MITIRPADDSDKRKWDGFVLSRDSSGPYLLFAWKEAIETAYRHASKYLLAEDANGAVQGVFPLVHVRVPFTRGVLVSLPFCDYGGILADSGDVRQALLQRALEIAGSTGAGLDIRCKAEERRLADHGALGVRSHKSRMLLNLPESSEILFNRFKSKLRSQIRRTFREEMIFRIGGSLLIGDFYRVMCRNMRDLGSPVHSRSWFTSVVDAFGDNARVGVVYKDGVPVGGGIILCCGDTVTIPWASTIKEYNSLSPNMLLYWEFLKFASDSGYKVFDFGRSTPGEGTFKFKEQWGAQPFPLYWYGGDTGDESAADPESPLRRYSERIWSRTPQFLTDFMGPKVRRFITL